MLWINGFELSLKYFYRPSLWSIKCKCIMYNVLCDDIKKLCFYCPAINCTVKHWDHWSHDPKQKKKNSKWKSDETPYCSSRPPVWTPECLGAFLCAACVFCPHLNGFNFGYSFLRQSKDMHFGDSWIGYLESNQNYKNFLYFFLFSWQ